jgi:hypothetical protein
MSSAVRVSVQVFAVAALVSMAGCGSSGSSTPAASTPAASASAAVSPTPASLGKAPAAKTLFLRANAAVSRATSARIAGSLAHGGSTVSFNLAITKSGDSYGTVALGAGQLTVLNTGGKSFVKVSKALLKQMRLPSVACTLMCGKWLKMTPADARSILGDFSWASMIGSTSQTPPGIKVQGSATVNGVPAWVLTSSAAGTIYLAARGQPYPLRVVAPGHAGRVDYTDWDTVTIPPPPPASDVVDLSQLG